MVARMGQGFVPGLHHSEAYYPNTTNAALCGPAWERLLSRVGDGVMMHLLLHCSLFLPLPNGCFLQASGTPIAQVRLATLRICTRGPPTDLIVGWPGSTYSHARSLTSRQREFPRWKSNSPGS